MFGFNPKIDDPRRAGLLRRLRNRNVGAGFVVIPIAVGHNHGEPVHRAALENADEDLFAACRAGRFRGKNEFLEE
jgi:hypothetical protein